ncbi:MAG: hypothetical protein IPH20_05045 [Bacteroidales bacterium]|nr:hypothetical protein [Bacteroidales bacterium]
MAPFTVHWTGPDGFTSDLENPTIPNVTMAAQGTYQVTVYDSYGCAPQTDEVFVTVNEAPDATITGGSSYCQFAGSPFIWFTATGGITPYTFEYNINGGPTQTVSTFGVSNSAFVFAPTDITGTFVYNLTMVTDGNTCSRVLNTSTTVVINSLPSAYITGDWVVCPISSGNIYTGNNGMEQYDWDISGKWKHSGSNQPANDQCNCRRPVRIQF